MGQVKVLTGFGFVLCIVCFALGAPPARAQSSGVNGFAFCSTLDPTSSLYVAGDPVYISEIFQVKVNGPDYKTAFINFLKQKYAATKYVTCSVSYNSDDATKTFNEKLK